MLVIAMLPDELPAVVGANVTVKDVFAPAFRVAGKASPLRLNPAPEAVAWEIVKLAVPEFESVMVCALFPPTRTFPKLTFVALALSCIGAVPVPVSDTMNGELDTLLVTDAVAVTFPAACGAN